MARFLHFSMALYTNTKQKVNENGLENGKPKVLPLPNNADDLKDEKRNILLKMRDCNMPLIYTNKD